MVSWLDIRIALMMLSVWNLVLGCESSLCKKRC